MNPADPGPQPRPTRQQPHTPSRPDTGTGYSKALARIRADRADERERIADERDRIADERERIADERDRIADERESLADRRERAADQRETRLDAWLRNRGHDHADLAGRGGETLARAAARAARNLAMISRERSAGERAEAARRRTAAAAPYCPSQLDSAAARAEFQAIMQRQRDTIAESQAAVLMADALRGSARETAAHVATARARRAESLCGGREKAATSLGAQRTGCCAR